MVVLLALLTVHTLGRPREEDPGHCSKQSKPYPLHQDKHVRIHETLLVNSAQLADRLLAISVQRIFQLACLEGPELGHHTRRPIQHRLESNLPHNQRDGHLLSTHFTGLHVQLARV